MNNLDTQGVWKIWSRSDEAKFLVFESLDDLPTYCPKDTDVKFDYHSFYNVNEYKDLEKNWINEYDLEQIFSVLELFDGSYPPLTGREFMVARFKTKTMATFFKLMYG